MSEVKEIVEASEPVEEALKAETKKLDMEAEEGTPMPSSHLGLTRDEMTWAALAHGSVLLTLLLGIATGGLGAILGVVVPALIWYSFRDKSEYVAEQARQATAFQSACVLGWWVLVIVGTLAVVIGWVVVGVLSIFLVGLLLIPVMLILTLLWVVAIVVLPIAQVVYGCYAAAEALNGRPFRYRWVADAVDRYQAQA